MLVLVPTWKSPRDWRPRMQSDASCGQLQDNIVDEAGMGRHVHLTAQTTVSNHNPRRSSGLHTDRPRKPHNPGQTWTIRAGAMKPRRRREDRGRGEQRGAGKGGQRTRDKSLHWRVAGERVPGRHEVLNILKDCKCLTYE